MKSKKLYWVLILLFCNCKEKYTPPAISTNKNYLVVEGTIVTGSDSTIVLLSRTSNISDTILPNPELGAQVTVLGEGNDPHPLTETGNGMYVSPGLNLSINQKYQLKISTADGKQYLSDLVTAKLTPPIDSLGWRQDSDHNVVIYVNTHDPANNTRYYQWNYIETWQYHAPNQTLFDWVNEQIVVRSPDQQLYNCWSYNNSSSINVASSAKLAQDVISQAPVALVNNSSEKIASKYSILVKQYALSQDAYEFWQTLKTTTEQLGTLFDPQPAQLQSNIHCVSNPGEVVVGFVSVASLQTKRIFINNGDVNYWFSVPYYNEFPAHLCDIRTVPADSIDYFLPPTGQRNYVLYGQPTAGSGYLVMPVDCLDCRTHGGTNIKPSFWP